jgi:hypothetical protein
MQINLMIGVINCLNNMAIQCAMFLRHVLAKLNFSLYHAVQTKLEILTNLGNTFVQHSLGDHGQQQVIIVHQHHRLARHQRHNRH